MKYETEVMAALDRALDKISADVPEDHVRFCRRVFSPPLDKYADRLRAVGLEGQGRVLDACAGFGQWSLVLSGLNEHVEAFDIDENRIKVLGELCRELKVDNIGMGVCRLDDMIYEDNSFDAVFCYGAIMCTPWKESLREIHRVLKPGGRVYMTANGFGYHVYVWVEEPNKTDDYSPRSFIPKTLQNTLDYQENGSPQEIGQIVIEPEEMEAYLADEGFTVVARDDEGHIDVTNGSFPPKPFFPGRYNGMVCSYEVLAEKKG